MQWSPTKCAFAIWGAVLVSNEVLDYIQPATKASDMYWWVTIVIWWCWVTTYFFDKVLYNLHATFVTSNMQWSPTKVSFAIWGAVFVSNEVLDYIQLATKTSDMYWRVTIVVTLQWVIMVSLSECFNTCEHWIILFFNFHTLYNHVCSRPKKWEHKLSHTYDVIQRSRQVYKYGYRTWQKPQVRYPSYQTCPA